MDNMKQISDRYSYFKSDHEIIDLFLISANELIIVSKNQIYKMVFNSASEISKFSKIPTSVLFNTKDHTKIKQHIKEVKFSKENEMFYLMLEHNEDSRKFVRVSLDSTSEKNCLIRSYSDKISQFELDHSNPDILYLIIESRVFRINITDKEQKFNLQLNEHLQVSKSKAKLLRNQSGSGSNTNNQTTTNQGRDSQKRIKDNTQLNDYYYQSEPLSSFRFHRNMKYFYCSDGILIQKYLAEKKYPEKKYEGHHAAVKSITFSEDFRYMFR